MQRHGDELAADPRHSARTSGPTTSGSPPPCEALGDHRHARRADLPPRRDRRSVGQLFAKLVRTGAAARRTQRSTRTIARTLLRRSSIVDRGRSIATGTPDELKALAGRDVVEIRVRRHDELGRAVELLAPLGSEAARVDDSARRVAVPVDDGTARLADAVRLLADARIELDDVGLRRPTLDEVFLTITGRPATDTTEDTSDDTNDRVAA